MPASRWETYSPVRHLLGAVFLNRDLSGCWMTAYTAYYDAGGTETDPGPNDPLVIAGLVGRADRWTEFAEHWQRVLGKYGVSYLHMKDFAHSRPPYDKWKAKPSRRTALIKRLVQVMKPCVNKAFVYRIVPADFHAVNERYVLDFSDQQSANRQFSPYPFLAFACALRLTGWLKTKHGQAPMLHVYEKGDTGQGPIHELQKGGGRFAVEPKFDRTTGKWFEPFQACDLVAFEYRSAIKLALEGKGWTHLQRFAELARMIPCDAVRLTQRGLFEMCRDLPEHFPPRRTNS